MDSREDVQRICRLLAKSPTGLYEPAEPKRQAYKASRDLDEDAGEFLVAVGLAWRQGHYLFATHALRAALDLFPPGE